MPDGTDVPKAGEATMNISRRQSGDVTIFDVSGRVVAGEAELLRSSIRDTLARSEKKIILNLAEVPYIDSAGIGELVSALVAVRRESGRLELLSLSRRVHDVLQTVKLLNVFQVFENEGDAVAACAAAQDPSRECVAQAS